MTILKTDICIIGAGSGGLSVAAGAVQLGKDVILLEGGKMGGDCLNYGCVPSKALLAAGNAAENQRNTEKFGITPVNPNIDFSKVHQHVHDVIGGIEPHDSVERFEGLGVKVIQEYGTFEDQNTIRAGDHLIKAKRFIIATGSSPSIPPFPGIENIDYLTNETIFNLNEAPEHLIVIGGGPVGLEMAQAHRRLGSKVTVIALKFMENDDPDLSAVLLKSLENEGINLIEGKVINEVIQNGQNITVMTEDENFIGTHLLIATGRNPNIDKLALEKADIDHSSVGINVGANLRTSNKAVYAIGDVTGGMGFTHKAGYDAGIIIRRVLFGMFWAKADYKALPRATYTSPSLASVGLPEREARTKFGDNIKILKWDYAENDRARATLKMDGMIKVITDKKGKILGASIVGESADELLATWTLAINEGLKIGSMANVISPYPTLGEISKRAASSFYTDSLFSERTRKIVKWLSKLG
ncbi:dihydrolipoyl dehydrogenase family protein [Pseudemcibacter aquimaris]|uniref:dihydrolipoyl dehydrogenase family protein n=1 Tax=Pseudemcibacter aquimaris TaxID=2857064 RepID=UPI00201151D1|nr:FAD-dependent oxidoreductase [Pseudemcibacter aquimaris]MCC3861418.1 FAD-dependent oxidoreductase [Pseudemcibacter aquimaris]WDU58188.1 FAD-dependent oxidoreductase [Pseudemcibacter aquimaris]